MAYSRMKRIITAAAEQLEPGVLHEMRLRQLTVLQCLAEGVANYLTSDEGDKDDTEDEFGLDVSEIIEMAHDNMILSARQIVEKCNEIAREYGVTS